MKKTVVGLLIISTAVLSYHLLFNLHQLIPGGVGTIVIYSAQLIFVIALVVYLSLANDEPY
ncbi:hypothetical protein [Brochothrix campestris]|uniref:Uncharacterized protein n=1 Tax=Brochothrix campestris FSL F6-1037 TaxID=1265861 RepID=W7D2W8_9LIST|nr:hypothetical protein [Brochothrix campestris]EUJ42236.1 hypothetical protein BCAMP_00565 [Brochothrix campestris FSL F6-1037]